MENIEHNNMVILEKPMICPIIKIVKEFKPINPKVKRLNRMKVYLIDLTLSYCYLI